MLVCRHRLVSGLVVGAGWAVGSGGFTAAGLCADQQIVSLHSVGDGGALNRGRLSELQFSKLFFEAGMESKVGKQREKPRWWICIWMGNFSKKGLFSPLNMLQKLTAQGSGEPRDAESVILAIVLHPVVQLVRGETDR